MSRFYESRSFWAIAHRGASHDAPENTLAAFDLALTQKADGIELDVQLAGSGEPVVVHDQILTRLAQRNVDVTKASLTELQSLDIGSWFDPRFKAERIPTLQAVWERYRGQIPLNIEIKCEAVRDRGLTCAVIDVLGKRPPLEQVMISSFNPIVLARLKRFAPQLTRGLIVAHDLAVWHRHAWFRAMVEADGIHCDLPLVEHFLGLCDREDRRLLLWTIDDIALMTHAIKRGVDGIMTNRPAILKTVIEGRV